MECDTEYIVSEENSWACILNTDFSEGTKVMFSQEKFVVYAISSQFQNKSPLFKFKVNRKIFNKYFLSVVVAVPDELRF